MKHENYHNSSKKFNYSQHYKGIIHKTPVARLNKK